MSVPDDDIGDIDDISWADPAVRTEYEAALGRFILAYNEVDYRISQVIKSEMTQRGRTDLIDTASKGSFPQRLDTLAILACASKDSPLARVPLEKLRPLHGHRNILAHGHFDQNPFDGSYFLVQRKKAAEYTVQHMLTLASQLAEIAEHLRVAEILYDFEDLDAKEPV